MRLYSRLSLVKVIVALVVLVIFLQALHMSLLTKLEAQEAETSYQRGRRTRSQTALWDPEHWTRANLLVLSRIADKIQNTHILDYNGMYKITVKLLDDVELNDVFQNQPGVKYLEKNLGGVDELRDKYDVSLVTHSTFSNLKHLIELSQRWSGPISVAIFVYGKGIIPVVRSITYLYVCYPQIRKQVRFHLVSPLNHPVAQMNYTANTWTSSCSDMPKELVNSLAKNYAMDGIKYPNNLLRNLAIRFSQTSFILMADMDMVPSKNLRTNFPSFVSDFAHHFPKLLNSTAFVVPVFESSNVFTPETKFQLLKSWTEGSIRPFYSRVCEKCQRPTDYITWRKNKRDLDAVSNQISLGVSHYVEWKDPWEPFYIVKKPLPMYDERFKQYGFNRISQVCELYVAGYTFAVLDSAFLVHRGFKEPEQFHGTKEREQQENRMLFRRFKTEIQRRYPESARKC